MLRRLQDQIPVEELALGDMTLIPRKREAIVRGRHVSLSPTESRFLATLAAGMPRAVSTDQLLHKVWADSDAATPPTSGSRCAGSARSSSSTPTIRIHLLTDPAGGYRLAAAGTAAGAQVAPPGG